MPILQSAIAGIGAPGHNGIAADALLRLTANMFDRMVALASRRASKADQAGDWNPHEVASTANDHTDGSKIVPGLSRECALLIADEC